MSKLKEALSDNAANIVAIAPAILPAIEPITGGLLTLGTGFLTSVFSKRHYNFEKDLRSLTTNSKFVAFLQKMEEDEEYKSYFSEYIAKNCQTPSARARNAMVIICKRMVNGEETLNHFTKTAMNTLMQLTDEDIAVFLVAVENICNIDDLSLLLGISAELANMHIDNLIYAKALRDKSFSVGFHVGINGPRYGINLYTNQLREVLLEEEARFAIASTPLI